MRVGEAHSLLTQFEQDIAEEQDPNLRAWYEQEFKLDFEYVVAQQAMESVGVLANQLGQLASSNSLEANNNLGEEDDELIEPEVEQQEILSPEQLLHQQIERKYASCLKAYDAEIASIAENTPKRSKREHQERLALRQFTRNFVDFKDITGDEHIVLQPKLLDWAITELISDEAAIDAVVASSADYAEHNGASVTSNPENFATIITASLLDKPTGHHFEHILRSVFSTRHNTNDFPIIHADLAKAVFEVMNDEASLEKILQISCLETPYVPSLFLQRVIEGAIKADALNDTKSMVETTQVFSVLNMLNSGMISARYSMSAKTSGAIHAGLERSKALLDQLSPERQEQLAEAFGQNRLSDPVIVRRLEDGTTIDIGIEPDTYGLGDLFKQSSLFERRMQHISPYFYAIKAAQKLTGSQRVYGLPIPFSPGIAVEAFVGDVEIPRTQIADYIRNCMQQVSVNQLLDDAIKGPELGVSSYRDTGSLQMACRPLIGNDERRGVLIFRPTIHSDFKLYPPLQQLTLNWHRTNSASAEMPKNEDFEVMNSALREEIRAEQKRFLGRRPVKFVMPEEMHQTGLESVKLRYEPKTGHVLADFSLNDGEVEVVLNRNFEITNVGFESESLVYTDSMNYYENLVLKLAKKWACSQELQTSEGIVSEASGNSANMGHFSYLRVRDGKKYRFSEQQRQACLEEQGIDLASESERLKSLDQTAQARNSTYVRENYDPSKPPLEVYYHSLS